MSRGKVAATVRAPLCGVRERAVPLGSSAVLTQAHRPLRLPQVLLLPERLALVPLLLASGQRDLHLGPTVAEVQLQRHHGVALVAAARGELEDLVAVQQQLALAPRCE